MLQVKINKKQWNSYTNKCSTIKEPQTSINDFCIANYNANSVYYGDGPKMSMSSSSCWPLVKKIYKL